MGKVTNLRFAICKITAHATRILNGKIQDYYLATRPIFLTYVLAQYDKKIKKEYKDKQSSMLKAHSSHRNRTVNQKIFWVFMAIYLPPPPPFSR
jgi:hypothetical protein